VLYGPDERCHGQLRPFVTATIIVEYGAGRRFQLGPAVLSVLEFLAGVGKAVCDFVFWRRDWNRTWSPVSYWLAASAAGVLLLVGVLYGAALWGWARGLLAGGS
jgi:hypothetical protein